MSLLARRGDARSITEVDPLERKLGPGKVEVASCLPAKHARVLLLDDPIDAKADDRRVSVPGHLCFQGRREERVRSGTYLNHRNCLKSRTTERWRKQDLPIRCLVASSITFHIRDPIVAVGMVDMCEGGRGRGRKGGARAHLACTAGPISQDSADSPTGETGDSEMSLSQDRAAAKPNLIWYVVRW